MNPSRIKDMGLLDQSAYTPAGDDKKRKSPRRAAEIAEFVGAAEVPRVTRQDAM